MNFNADSGKFQTSKVKTSKPTSPDSSLNTLQGSSNGEYEEYEEPKQENGGIFGELKEKLKEWNPNSKMDFAIENFKVSCSEMGLNVEHFDKQFIQNHMDFFLPLALSYAGKDFSELDKEEVILDLLKRLPSSGITYEELKENFSNIDEVVCNSLKPYVDNANLGIRLNEESVKILYEHSDAIARFAELFRDSADLESAELLRETIRIAEESDIPYRDVNALFENLPDTLHNFLTPYEETLGLQFNLQDENVKNIYEAFLEKQSLSRGIKMQEAILNICPELPSYLSDLLRKKNVYISARAIERRIPNLFFDLDSTLDCLEEITTLSKEESRDTTEILNAFNDICDLLDIGLLARTSTALSFGAASYLEDDFPQAAGTLSAGVVDFMDVAKDTLTDVNEKREELMDNIGDAVVETKNTVLNWGADRLEDIRELSSDLVDCITIWD